MANYAVETRSTSPKNFFAGDFPTLAETGTAGEDIKEFAPVTTDGNGKIVNISASTKANVIGISAEAAKANEPVVYYMTGEFFANALNMPTGVTQPEIVGYLRKLSIFLRQLDAVIIPGVTLDVSTATIYTSGNTTKQLTATTVPGNAEVTWASSDSTKASVSDSGLVTALAAGSTNITATITVDGQTYTATCAVTVVAQSISLSDSTASIVKDATKQLTATVVPSGSTVTWASSDEEKATVSDSGLVTAVAAGEANITASITVGGATKTATCAVTVTSE